MKMKFNVYLFRPEIADFPQVFRPERIKAYKEVEFIEDPPFEARAFLLTNKRSTPPWVGFFDKYCKFPRKIDNISNSFVLVIKRDERLFALTYGQGYLALDRAHTDPTFGLSIAVNAVLPDQIRSTESRNLKETATLKQLVLSRASGLEQFEVDFDHEVLHRLEGALREEAAIGSRVRGAQACAIVAEIEFGRLGRWCDTLLEVFGGQVPERMQRALTLQPVRNADLIDELDDKLLEALIEGSSEALHLSPSDVRNYNLVESYALVLGQDDDEKVIALSDLEIEEVRPHLAGLDQQSFVAADPRIRGLDENDELVAEQPLLTTVVFETVHEERLYVHQPYYWVEISRDLVARLERRLVDFAAPDEFSLPGWDDDIAEGPYNDAVGRDEAHLLSLDRKLVPVGGSRIEACDLLSKDGHFIHVKEYKSSQSITHLVGQAQVSSDLLIEDLGFRRELRKIVEAEAAQHAPGDDDWKSVVELDTLRPVNHPIVLAIGAARDRAVPESLPYLGKQALFDTLLWLQRLGYPSFIYKIDKA